MDARRGVAPLEAPRTKGSGTEVRSRKIPGRKSLVELGVHGAKRMVSRTSAVGSTRSTSMARTRNLFRPHHPTAETGLPESRHEISASRFRQRLDHKKYQISQLSQWTTDELSRERQQGASSADDKNKRQEAVQACSLSLRVLWRRERGQ